LLHVNWHPLEVGVQVMSRSPVHWLSAELHASVGSIGSHQKELGWVRHWMKSSTSAHVHCERHVQSSFGTSMVRVLLSCFAGFALR